MHVRGGKREREKKKRGEKNERGVQLEMEKGGGWERQQVVDAIEVRGLQLF